MFTTLIQKPGNIIPALLTVVLVYLAYLGWSLNQWTIPNFSSETLIDHKPTFESIDTPKSSTISSPPAPPSPSPSATPLPPSGILSEPLKDAHTLPSADAFLSHFKAVTNAKGMTMAEAKSGCTWKTTDEVNFQYGGDAEWAANDRNDTELDFRREQWHDFIENELLPYNPYKDRFEGRGIIIVAGNQKGMHRVRVLLRALAKLGTQLPVEIHYWEDEMDQALQANLSTLWPKMYFNDLSGAHNILKTGFNAFLINYQFKTAAVMNSRFAEPLLLDTDNIPVINPEELYESSIYKEYGTLFWPDIARTRPNNPMWAITNTQCRMDEYEQESGQLIVNKRKYFYHLQLAAWFNNVHNAYYNQFLLGDKDMFRFAWHALQTKYGFPPKWITSVGTEQDDGSYCGHTFAQHHPDGRVAFLHGGLLKTVAKQVLKYEREKRGGVFQKYKRSRFDEQHNKTVQVGIRWDEALWLPDRPEDLHPASCTDMLEVETRPFDELVPHFEERFEEYGGYWMLEDTAMW